MKNFLVLSMFANMALLFLLAYCVHLLDVSKQAVEKGKESHQEDLKDLLTALRDEYDAPCRFEVDFNDWGTEHQDMRYRWTVWDADRLLATAIDPELDPVGSTVPFMLGNAPTRKLAEQHAMDWIHDQRLTRMVVVRPDKTHVVQSTS